MNMREGNDLVRPRLLQQALTSADYERLVEFIVSQIRNKEAGREEALERSIACMALGLENDEASGPVRRGRSQALSFRWIAASVCLQEIERLQKTRRF